VSNDSISLVIIEDLALLRDLLEQEIRGIGAYEVVRCADRVATAIPALRELRPDLVLLNWLLPDGTGEDVMRSLAGELPDTRWLILCTQAHGQPVQTALGLGAQGFVMKQSELGSLREALRRLAEGGTYYCPLSSSLLLEALRNRARPNGDGLTERELDVLRRYALGLNPKTIALQIGVSPKTVQNQLSAIRQKLNIQETAGLVRYAIRQGIA
jgi:DNA-binding NarL/FixJ family response regulator